MSLYSNTLGVAIAQSTYATYAGGEIAALRQLLEQRGADFLIAVKHLRRRGFQVISDRLTYGRKAPHEWSHRERRRGRDLRWTLRGMPAPHWVMENWPGRATILAVRCKGIREGKPVDETRYYVTSLHTAALARGASACGRPCCSTCATGVPSKIPGTGLATLSSERTHTATAKATASGSWPGSGVWPCRRSRPEAIRPAARSLLVDHRRTGRSGP
ncbi:MAG: hypothetical protein VKK05_08700 [Synechococcus sp.]|nr:hypothetical protein [Synechococcus sp.]